MTESRNKRKKIIASGLVILVFLLELGWRYIYWESLGVAYGLFRSIIYIAMFSVWAISIEERILHKYDRRLLLAVADAILFWMLLRTCKFYFVTTPNVLRVLWYLYYIPILAIPTLLFLMTFLLGSMERSQMKKYLKWLWIPSVVLLLLVLTNDFHQFVFVFPSDCVWTDKSYVRGWGYYAVLGWVGVLSMATLAHLIRKCRIPYSKKRLWLPLLPIFFIIFYIIWDIAWKNIFGQTRSDFTVWMCLMTVATIEGCIQCWLIRSNRYDRELFHKCGIRARIVDEEYRIYLASEDASDIERNKMKQAERENVFLDEKHRLLSAKITGGHIIWEEDVSELLLAKQKLEEVKEGIRNRQLVLQKEYETRYKKEKLREKNRLYNKIQEETQEQIQQLKFWTKKLKNSFVTEQSQQQNSDRKDVILWHIAVLLAYIKRRNNLIFIAEETEKIPVQELAYCLQETLTNLQLGGIECSLQFHLNGTVSYEEITQCYTAFQEIIESVMECTSKVVVSVIQNHEKLLLKLYISCPMDLTKFERDFIKIEQI